MRKFVFAVATLGMVFGLAARSPCRAESFQSYHTYVSAGGGGTACTLEAPCLNLTAALAATYAGGEISCIGSDSYTFGTGVITQSVTIDCAGVPAIFDYIVVNGSGAVVTLRNLIVNGFNAEPTTGIDFQNGAALFVENCVIEHWDYPNSSKAIGINFAPPAGVTAKLHVTDSVIKNNGTASAGGAIMIQPAVGAEADVTIERTKVENNYSGIVASTHGIVRGVVRDSVVSGSTTWGIGAAGPQASLLVENTTVTNNNAGLVSETSAGMLVSHSSIVLNTNGLYTAGGGSLMSYKNNNLNRNIHSDGAFTGSLAQQ
jgi:Right handed beta helix region